MSSWATKRRFTFISILGGFFLIFIVLPGIFIFYKAPTCYDGKQNQDEVGVDCGGRCPLLCSIDALSPVVLWQRVFRVSEGSYNVVAYVENPNLNSGAVNVPYLLKLYDEKNILVYEKTATTFLPPHKTIAVFIAGIMTGERIPTRASFEFIRQPVWVKGILRESELKIQNPILSAEGEQPHFEMDLKNTSTKKVSDIEVVVIVYDEKDNAVGASRTIVDAIGPDASAPLVFTWPEAFSQKGTRVQAVYRFLPR
jgi:hypothetical protein